MKKLKSFMKKNNLNQADLAKLLKVNPSTVCRWFNGTHKPGQWPLFQIDCLLGKKAIESYRG